MNYYFLCDHHDLISGKSRSFSLDTPQGTMELFAIKLEQSVYVYKNNCPHLGISLNWQQDEFLSQDESNIQCSTHGALFTIEDGHCIAGPCSGQSLHPIRLEYRQDEIWLHINDECAKLSGNA